MVLLTQEILLKGTPICPGIAIGKAFFFTYLDDKESEYLAFNANPEREIIRYTRAIEKCFNELQFLKHQLQIERAHDAMAILDAQLLMLDDPLMTENVISQIKKSEKNAEYVFQKLIKQYQKKFAAIEDPFFSSRFKDIQDLSRRIMGHLRERIRISLADVPVNSIVFAQELTASDAAEAKISSVSAFVTSGGGTTSHSSIVAKSKGIPYVTGVNFDRLETPGEGFVIVDGRTGEIFINPSNETLKKYQDLQYKFQTHIQCLHEVRHRVAETFDGYQVLLSANIDMISEFDLIEQYPGHGVGLFRSEYIFLSHREFPSEEDQTAIYSTLASKMKGLPVVIRTFDLSGDKFSLSQAFQQEGKSIVESRAIRFLLGNPDIFKTQLRAILKASMQGNIRILLPMVSSLSELQEAKYYIQKARKEVQNEGFEVKEHIPVGCMIEVPSAAIIADLLAKECDFLSIGTNDLVQYTLAVDRSNHQLNVPYHQTHPGVLRLIKLVVMEANRVGIPVSVCGEIASDPRFTPLLLGLGVQELSVALRYIPIVKNAIRHTSIVEACKLAEKALELTNGNDIFQLISDAYRANLPDDAFFG